MPQLDLGSVLGPQGPKGDPGNQGTVGPRGPQGEQGDAGKDATINGVNALTIETGDGLEATMTGSAYNLKLTDNTLNAVRVVPTFTRPNLLDNWYFGRPVDQRGGYIVPKGVNYYKVDGLVLQGPIPETVRVDYIDESGSARFDYGGVHCYVPKGGGYVRGYTGTGYTVDRWISTASPKTVQAANDHLAISDTADYGGFFQRLEYESLRGKTVTFTTLAKCTAHGTQYPYMTVMTGNNKYEGYAMIAAGGDYQIASCTVTFPETALSEGHFAVDIVGMAGSSIEIIAAKLELGPTQTLAHQENGVWVLNEVPEYGGQLARCQRYFVRLNSHAYGWTYNNSTANCLIPLPVTLRTTPVITLDESGTINTVNGDAAMTSYEVKNVASNGLIIDVHNSANALTTGTPVVWHNFDISISADL